VTTTSWYVGFASGAGKSSVTYEYDGSISGTYVCGGGMHG
jgi:hypothetical protein